MENTFGIQLSPDLQTEVRLAQESDSTRTKSVERLSILDWYRILRSHYHFTLFQAIRFSLWLSR
jgi:hypothetical protein